MKTFFFFLLEKEELFHTPRMTLRKFSAPSQVWGNIPSQQTLCYQFPAEICLMDCVHGTLHEDFGARANKNCSNQFKPAFPVTAISRGQRRSPCESWCLYIINCYVPVSCPVSLYFLLFQSAELEILVIPSRSLWK